MRQDLQPVVSWLVGAMSLAALAASPGLEAADSGLPLPHAQATSEPSLAQPVPQAEPHSRPPAVSAPSGPAGQTSPAPAHPDSTPPGRPATVVLEGRDVRSILGRKVLSAAGEDMGRIIDVIVDEAGTARAAVIDFGGFLGVGSRKIAVAWNALHFPMGDSERIALGFTRDQVKAAPEYHEGRPVVVLSTFGDPGWLRFTTAKRSEQ